MTDLRLYNTLTRSKQVFVPAEPARVTMYVCGPTVYGRAHIGNARPAVVFDVLRRVLRHRYGAGAVVYARNITDIDDKIITAADAEGVPIDTITQRFEDHYLADMGALGVEPPDHAPHATAYVAQMVAMIDELVARGVAYAAEGHVLFDVAAFPDYGKLSGRRLDEMIAGARVEVAPYKKSPADFVLWKPSWPEQPGWDSPWGRGRPGWHIECSAMIREVLGETIDIHGGGLDLIFPHHENEAAQSACAHGGAPLARVWMHNGFLSMGADKMSKSLGNVALIDELLAAGWSGEVLRLALLSAHYRQPLEWSDALLTQTKATLDRWQGFLRRSDVAAGEVPERVIAALSDDLNTPDAVAAIARLSRLDDVAGMRAAMGLLGLLEPEGEGDAAIDAAVAARVAARARKDFAESDRIRDGLAAQGVVLEDSPSGTTWRRV
ncbi:cysteine--tRNA ligase [Glacieibacterium frigidum]|uniref:Cysteine--tRNA ligase n=1 Tax=Glacieibacterium frigidum TaxID=2593303 RepID=A0A552UF40_9SPHN|nr:cysteine--tRNA ligase [Glacieibacterium frigidum]TRW16830.1 cysteine--tRNA ligase [Glacieibacterium frigidum]